ncbi:MAG: hypothetical protein F4Y14_17890 [Acidobacteria bacterium]|nr:hypothetical protein [Acidobacteriota bacterium]
MVDEGAKVADRLPARAGTLVENARHAEVAPHAMDGNRRAVVALAPQDGVVLERGEHAVAHGAVLPGHLGGAE